MDPKYHMFVDLDWLLNASSPLSASAELLVNVGSGLNCISGGPTRLMNIRLDKITVNNIGVYRKKNNGNDVPLFKKERERRSHAFPSDSNPASRPDGTRVITEIRWGNWTHRVLPFKVTQSHWNRDADDRLPNWALLSCSMSVLLSIFSLLSFEQIKIWFDLTS